MKTPLSSSQNGIVVGKKRQNFQKTDETQSYILSNPKTYRSNRRFYHSIRDWEEPPSLKALLVILLLAAAHPLVPASLADTGFVVRCNSLHILHDALNGSTGLVAVAVHYHVLATASQH